MVATFVQTSLRLNEVHRAHVLTFFQLQSDHACFDHLPRERYAEPSRRDVKGMCEIQINRFSPISVTTDNY